jgi:hypothetical protein
VADGTRARGRSDTTASRAAAKRTRRPFPRRAFAIAVAVAFVLHLPFLPSNLGAWMERMLHGNAADYDDRDASAIIPIDLDLMNDEPSPTAAGTAPPPAPEAPKPPSTPAADGTTIVDAGAPHVDPLDAGADAKAPRKKKPPTDAGTADDAGPIEDAGSVDAGPPSVRDPIGAAGGAGKISSKDPNVQVLIAGNVIRKHQLGAAFARILVLIPEWHQFFADSPIDPIRDLNHLLITAPRFRGDTSKVVAVMDFNVPEAKIKDAVDLIVNGVNGSWLDDTPVPTARATIGGGDRLFAMVPGKRLLVVLPFEAKDQLEGLKKSKGFPNSKVGIAISMVTPARPFKGFFPLPDTLKWLRVAVTPTADGGADVALEASDASEKDAQLHAPALTKAIDEARIVNLIISIEIFDHIELVAEGASIKGQVHVSDTQLRRVVGMAEMQLAGQARDRAAAAAAASAKPAPPTPTPRPGLTVTPPPVATDSIVPPR